MPTNLFPLRNPRRGISLRASLVSCIDRRLIALLLVILLAFPVVLVRPREAGAKITLPSVSSAPPESFVVQQAETRAVASFLPRALESLSNLISEPTLPAGFESAKLPTLSERLASNIQPILGMIAPTKAASRDPKSEMPTPPPGTVLFDFDGDGKADIGRWHAANTRFEIRNSGTGTPSHEILGSSSSVPAPGDFDGDGKTDVAVFNAGSWTIKKSSNGSTINVSFGTTGDKPVAADYDGDGKTDAAVFRPSTNVWWVLKSSDSNYTSTSFGSSGDIPVTGNWDGDSYADIAVFRPSNGNWYVQQSTDGFMQKSWGLSSDVPVPADFDGDNATDIAVYRPSTGVWWVMKSSTDFDGTHFNTGWGNYGDQPVPADYDEDGKADLAVWRPKTGVWYVAKSSEVGYEYYGLGTAGDAAVPSAYIKQVATTVYGDDMASARLSPKNETGGTNLYSRNFSWGTQLVGLPGRSGLDAGFGIGYNSLVWTKLGSDIHFDVDQSNVSPGFRFGFPTIEAPYYDDGDKDVWSFMMVTPSGSKVEFRQTAVSNTYETADSNYTQLKIDTGDAVDAPPETIGIDVRTTDGTLMRYEWLGGAYRCIQIKDRNGNYITIDHDEDGTLRTVTDTLGRVITVNYDSQLYPTSITQTWKDGNGGGSNTTHTWASFTYTTKTVATSFGSLSVIGPPNDTVVKVLQKVTYADGSYTKFTHNGYIQAEKIENYAADDHLLNYVRTNLDSISGTQSDCPRFSATYTKVDNFNLSSGVPQEIEVTNSLATGASYSLPGSLSGTATRIDLTMTGHPDGLYSRTYVAESGWKEGLILATEDCIGTNCSDRKRWTWTDWTQDDTGLSYPLNPRVIESRVGDGTNTKKSTIEYWLNTGTTVAIYGLVKSAYVFDTDLSTVLKKTYTTYNLDTAFSSRRIIGLASMSEIYGRETSGLNLMSKITYEYDEGDFSESGLQQNISPTQHCTTTSQHCTASYGSSFTAGRGNLTSIRRWDATDPEDENESVLSSVKYNIAGSVVAQYDPLERITKIGYTDNFNSTVGVSTYAYPTTLTDANGNSSSIKYRYDIGANVEASSPTPHEADYGKITKRLYDNKGRLERNSVYLNTTEYSYTRYEYPTNGIQSQVYSTIADADGDNQIADDEAYHETWSDGAGRVFAKSMPHPGSTGGWAASKIEYDILGRVKKQSVPTEISVSGSTWTVSGDDSAFKYNEIVYDWMGRPTRSIPSDSNGTDGKDTLYEYAGCGCAGGLVTTVKGPVTTAIDIAGNTQTTKRRVQKSHADVLGRTFKTELWDLDGAGSAPYSTTVLIFNGRDQVTLARQYSGGTSSSTYQDTTSIFDGHGRLLMRHNPIETSSANTSWTYNDDDTVATVTDPRGAVISYSYGNPSASEKRALLTGISYTGGTNIPDPGDVAFEYDSVGNRTLMKDGIDGSNPFNKLTYKYDFLSRLREESKEFADAPSGQPSGGYLLKYTYHLEGGIKSIESPFEELVAYKMDKIGRTTEVDGSGFDDFSPPFVTGISYRAFGGVKSMQYETNDETNISLTYDAAQRPLTFEVESEANNNDVHNKTYSYYNDGTVKEAANNVDSTWGQLYEYDFAARLRKNEFGTGTTDPAPIYKQTLAYDAFDNITTRNTLFDGTARNFTAGYTNHRRTSGGWGSGTDQFDAAGNVTSNQSATLDYRTWKFDAGGRMTEWHETSEYGGITRFDQEETLTFDGDGRTAKRAKRSRMYTSPPGVWDDNPTYYLYSSVTGQTITEVDAAGERAKTNVYLGNTIIADDEGTWGVRFKTTDPVAGSVMQSEVSGEISPYGMGRSENNALGDDVPTHEPEIQEPHGYRKGGSISAPESQCSWNWAPVNCNTIWFILGNRGTHEVYVNTRAEGGWSLYSALQAQISVWKYDVYKVTGGPPVERPRGTGPPRTKTLVDTFYMAFLDVYIAEMLIGRLDQLQEPNDDGDLVPLPTDLRTRLENRASRGSDCAKAVENLIQQTARNTGRKAEGKRNIGNLFDRMGTDKIRLDAALSPFEGKVDEKIGVFGKRGFRIGPVTQAYLKEKISTYPNLSPSQVLDRLHEGYVSTALHELVHHAAKNGTYSDAEVARAARDLLLQAGLPAASLPDVNNTSANSRYINANYLYRYCPSPYKDVPLE